ncbi:hypothetical protein FW755_03235 [Lonepinella koalarum]|uniref:hypothetical protein n=1 Tax=Lonepinella koalarum TaxID=53417 RepID=UPI0011E48896|nr:hypothetical protein [Lonepinella koalarum]TYG34172.1 hypothetical protein FW755_03235 [Lonepinella koalarum]
MNFFDKRFPHWKTYPECLTPDEKNAIRKRLDASLEKTAKFYLGLTDYLQAIKLLQDYPETPEQAQDLYR